MKKILAYILLSFFAITIVTAEIKLPAIFGNNMLLQQNTDVNIWGWSDKNKTINITPSWSGKTYTVKTGSDGKWTAKIPTPAASYNTYTLQVADGKDKIVLSNILIGEVWLCSGQSNMEMPMKGFKNQPIVGGNEAILKSKNKNIRFITLKRTSTIELQNDIIGEWFEASPETVKNLSATGYFFGKTIHELLDVPVGLIVSSWGGSCVEAWMSKDMLQGFKEIAIPQKKEDIKEENRTPTTLFNGMINPIAGYTIKGSIWYQGESNYERPAQYLGLFKTMVSEWRKLWQQGDFPFYYCQIAPYDYELIVASEKKGLYNSALLREAQYKAATEIPNSGMAVLMDIGEKNCIHPQNKKAGGERLAMMALAKTYGLTGFGFESPIYKEMVIEENKAVLSFDNAPMWLTSFGHEMKAFEIAGEDKVFYPAKAEIKRSKIEVSSDKVAKPVAVRYAFKDFVVGDLFSTEGLPMSSFRTDNWNE